MRLNDYINMILYTRNSRCIEDSIRTISISQAGNLLRRCNNVQLVDVRSPQEYAEGHREKAILIPNYEMAAKAQRILKNKNDIIILYCTTGIRAKKSALTLQNLGYMNVYVLE